MDESEELASEEFEVNFEQARMAWCEGLGRGQGKVFLERLWKMMANDPKFAGDESLIVCIIEWLQNHAVPSPNQFATSHVAKLKSSLGLTDSHIRKLDYLVIQLEALSPTVSMYKKQSSFARKPRHSMVSNRYSSADDYEDDFEIEEEGTSVMGSSDEEGEYAYEDVDETVAAVRATKIPSAYDIIEEEEEKEEEEELPVVQPNSSGRSVRQIKPANVPALQHHSDPGSKKTMTRRSAAQAESAATQQQQLPVATASTTPRNMPTPAKSTDVLPRKTHKSGSVNSSSVSKSSGGRRNKPMAWIEKGEFRLGKVIGKGSFGEVYQCYATDSGKIYAAKKLHMVKYEDLMRNLQHENIVQYFGSKIDEAQGIVYIFLEWVPGGSVAHVLKEIGPFQFGTVASYTRQILVGLEFLHLNGVIHRCVATDYFLSVVYCLVSMVCFLLSVVWECCIIHAVLWSSCAVLCRCAETSRVGMS